MLDNEGFYGFDHKLPQNEKLTSNNSFPAQHAGTKFANLRINFHGIDLFKHYSNIFQICRDSFRFFDIIKLC